MFGRDLVQLGGVPQDRERAHLLGRGRGPGPVCRERVPSVCAGVHDEGEVHVRTEWDGLVLQRGDHPEVASGALERPEQVRVLGRARGEHLAVGRDDVGGAQRVAAEPVLAAHPAEAPAQGEPGDAGLGHHAHRDRQPERLGLAVQVADGHAALRPDRSRAGVDPHGAHRRQVDDQAAVADGVARHVVPAAAHGDRQTVLAPEGHGGPNVGDPDALHDEPRALVHHAVPHRAGLVVAGILGPDHAPSKPSGQLGDRLIEARVARGFAHRAPPESPNRPWAGTLGRRLDDAPDPAPAGDHP